MDPNPGRYDSRLGTEHVNILAAPASLRRLGRLRNREKEDDRQVGPEIHKVGRVGGRIFTHCRNLGLVRCFYNLRQRIDSTHALAILMANRH